MKHRTWILEALRLHFDEKLPRIEAGRRLGIPKTTVCELFARFSKAGLPWPLPARISARSLEKRLYRPASRKAAVLPAAPEPAETPAPRRRPRRPNFPRDFKISLVEHHSHSKRNKVTHLPESDKITVLAILESLLHAGKTSDSERTVLHRKAAW